MRQDFPSLNSFPGSIVPDENQEIMYGDILLGYRNMLYGSGWNGFVRTLDWALWNKFPVHLEKIQVTTRSGYEDAFQVYASDEPFVDGLPAATDEPLASSETLGQTIVFLPEGKSYFLVTGNRGIWLNRVDVEYYH